MKENMKESIKSALNTFVTFAKKVIKCICVVAFIFFALYFLINSGLLTRACGDKSISDTKKKFDFTEEEQTVTSYDVRRELEGIGEFATYEQVFSGVRTISDSRSIASVNLPLTGNSITFAYSGVIKVGFSMDDVNIKVDNNDRVITIAMPMPEVLDRYIDEDSVEVVESHNNIFNPFNGSEITDSFSSILDEQEHKASEDGIYELAEENFEDTMSSMLSIYEEDGYTIRFRYGASNH